MHMRNAQGPIVIYKQIGISRYLYNRYIDATTLQQKSSAAEASESESIWKEVKATQPMIIYQPQFCETKVVYQATKN